MEYNFLEIGDRIRRLREAINKNQDDFVDALREVGVSTSRNTISSMENGDDKKFRLDIMLGCCRLFNCDMGYLLGEYGECKTRDEQFILNETGLSQLSVERLVSKYSDPQNAFLDALISSDSFTEMDFVFFEYMALIRRCNENTAWFAVAEKELVHLNPKSDEATALNNRLGKAMMASGNMERSIFALEYQLSLSFGEMLKNYRKKRLIQLGVGGERRR